MSTGGGPTTASTWERVAGLALTVDGYTLEGLTEYVSSDFERRSTVVHLSGAGEEGLGEDVTYDAIDHEILQRAGAVHRLAGSWTLGSFAERIAELDLFPGAPQREVSRRYRAWAWESAALDLALRQASTTLHDALDRDPAPVRFVSSMRLGEPPSLDGLRRRLALYPWMRFKLDPTSSWDLQLIEQLASLEVVDSVDFKGLYVGSAVDQPADPALYRRVVEHLPRAWIEDPALTPETEAILERHRGRLCWDAPIHSIADIQALAHPPRMVNIKPSRLGGVRSLFDALDYCAAQGIGNYGGGQFELGVGRGQIQYLASLFHADAPNDVAPSAFNLPEPPAGLPASPLPARPSPTGFRWN